MFSETRINKLFKKKNLRNEYSEINICEPKNINRKKRNKRIIKCVILGDSNIGKTTIVKNYFEKNIKTPNESTLGATFWELKHNYKDSGIKINFWDTAGQERYNSLIPMYVRDCDIVVLTFDLTNTDSLKNIKKWYNFVINNYDKPYIILVGNKVDLELYRNVSQRNIENSIKENNFYICKVFETSGFEGTNIQDLFNYIFKLSEKIIDETYLNETKEEEEKIMKKQDKCCILM